MQTGFFNMTARSKAGEDLYKEGVDYVKIKDGNGVEYKVVNFENEDICKRTGIIQLVPLKVEKRHENRVGFKIVTDRASGIIYGIPNGVNAVTKQIEWMKINLNDHETLDLTVPLDAMKWVVIKNSFFLQGSPNLQGKPKYKVVDIEREAHLFAQKRVVKRKAVDFAEALVGKDLENMARVLGIPPEANSPATLYMEVVKRAEDDPKRFMELVDSPTRKELVILKQAVANGVVTDELATGYTYRGTPMGQNEAMAVEFLRENPNVCRAIDTLSKQVSDESDVSNSRNVPITTSPVVDEKDARLAKLEAEIAAKDELLRKLSSDKIVEDAGEHGVWLAEAKRLNVKGCHMIKSLETLKEKVLALNPDFEV